MSTGFLIYAFSHLIVRSAVFRVALVITRQFATASTLFECGFSFFEVGAMVPKKMRITCGRRSQIDALGAQNSYDQYECSNYSY